MLRGVWRTRSNAVARSVVRRASSLALDALARATVRVALLGCRTESEISRRRVLPQCVFIHLAYAYAPPKREYISTAWDSPQGEVESSSASAAAAHTLYRS